MEEGTRTMPASIDAERSVLGAILISPDSMELASDRITADDFALPAHQDIFSAMYELFTRGKPVDIVTVIDALERRGRLQSVGGAPYIAELATSTPTAANVARYLEIVYEHSVMRSLIKAGNDVAKDGYDGAKPVDDMLDDAEKRIYNISMRNSNESLKPISQYVEPSYKRLGELDSLRGKLTGVPTGFGDLDKLTSGLQKGDLIILAARPSVGKTSLALNIACNAAVRHGKSVAIFSLEMNREQLVMRMLCSESEVSLQEIKLGKATTDDFVKLSDISDPLTEAPIYLDDTSSISVNEVRSRCRRQKAQRGLDLVIIDYLQLMQPASNRRSDSRVNEVSDMTRAMKILAKDLEVPVILLSQLSRKAANDPTKEKSEDRRPQMSDLRDSGAIEQDADVIMMLHRPKPKQDAPNNIIELLLVKNRNGPVDDIKLTWQPEYTKFSSCYPYEE